MPSSGACLRRTAAPAKGHAVAQCATSPIDRNLKPLHFHALAMRSHNSHTAPHNITYVLVQNVLAFFSRFDLSQPITRLGVASLASRNRTGGQSLGRREEQRSKKRRAGEVLMEATHAAHSGALTARSRSVRSSVQPPSPTTSGSTAAPIKIPPANGAAAPRIAASFAQGRQCQAMAAIRSRHRHLWPGHHRQCRRRADHATTMSTRSSRIARRCPRPTAPIGAASGRTARRAASSRRRREVDRAPSVLALAHNGQARHARGTPRCFFAPPPGS